VLRARPPDSSVIEARMATPIERSPPPRRLRERLRAAVPPAHRSPRTLAPPHDADRGGRDRLSELFPPGKGSSATFAIEFHATEPCATMTPAARSTAAPAEAVAPPSVRRRSPGTSNSCGRDSAAGCCSGRRSGSRERSALRRAADSPSRPRRGAVVAVPPHAGEARRAVLRVRRRQVLQTSVQRSAGWAA
jgi:hypothetical protein